VISVITRRSGERSGCGYYIPYGGDSYRLAPGKLFWEVTVGGAENICRAAVDAKVSRLV